MPKKYGYPFGLMKQLYREYKITIVDYVFNFDDSGFSRRNYSRAKMKVTAQSSGHSNSVDLKR